MGKCTGCPSSCGKDDVGMCPEYDSCTGMNEIVERCTFYPQNKCKKCNHCKGKENG